MREAMEASKPFVASGLTNGAQQLSASVSSNIQASYTVGSSTRSWYDAVTGTTLSTVLRQQAGLSNGQNLNVWVQNSAWTATGASNKVTQTLVDLVSSEFANSGTGIFDLATSVAGQPWGTTGNANLISSSQDIHIVVTNFTNDNTASSVLGYFYAANNFLKTTSGMGNSNEALVFFIDAQSLASAATMYQDIMVSTLAHEFTHMINFYQREVLKGSSYGFDTWLEEASAMMMEDLLNPLIITSFNDIRDSRIPGWLAAGINNCSLNVYDANSSTCFSYNIGAAYGAYLLRQYGVGFYKTLLQSDNTDSLTALEKSIAASDSSAGFLSSLPRWGASIALLDSSLLPTGFGYPARSVSVNGNSYTVPALNGPDYASDRKLSSLPNSLKAYAHAAQSYSASGSTFSRTVSIPANTVLTVVVN
ncbi:M30 family zinc metallopeptidase [Candidatus Dactylopiibacterium carminicum]|uniref:M30 family zinc metallopeptidase n=1 Tax=Candidatus Dactylopiibacterium carminicum TaxID=857335 RepID=UPI0014826F0D|nr:hypothetical protein [Candidatus Dactylopiibacterium carminicum]